MANEATLHPEIDGILSRWRTLSRERCALCSGLIESGRVTLLSREPHHAHCAVTAAAGVASTVLDGGDAEAREVSEAARILVEAAHVLYSTLGGRA